ncbi:major histocompatibility complex class I-related gene protein-like [Discoglossus pictus]
MKHISVALFMMFISVILTSGGSHTHMFLSTVTNKDDPNFPSYFASHELDNVTLYWYDSQVEILEIRAPWFKKINSSMRYFNFHHFFENMLMKSYLNGVMNHLGETEGYHILQNLEICTLHDDGTVNVVANDAYDGDHFTIFNMDTAKWTAVIPKAESLVEILNFNQTVNENFRTYIQERCVKQMSQLLVAGNAVLNRKDKPVVRITNQTISKDSMILHCRAYDHYPMDISMTWKRNGQQIEEKDLHSMTLPLPNHNYLSSISVNVTVNAGDTYTCKVIHSSLENPLTVEWNSHPPPRDGLSIGIVIAICLAIILVLSITVFGLVTWSKKRSERILPERFTNHPSS